MEIIKMIMFHTHCKSSAKPTAAIKDNEGCMLPRVSPHGCGGSKPRMWGVLCQLDGSCLACKMGKEGEL